MENKKDLRFICAQPVDKYFTWQVHLWLESLKILNYSNKAIVLVFVPPNRDSEMELWEDVQKLYPESEFNFYKDVEGVSKLLPIYIPIIRPYVLMKYFSENPEMENKAVFYCDCDVLFTDKFNIDKYIDNNTCYVSNTLSYINASYFDSKIKGVLPDKLEEFKTRDILDETCKLVGISREIAEKYNLDSGGAQYLLKNIDASFWEKVITDCIRIRLHLQEINEEFFESENKGFQSWCADMWAVLWNLWLREYETKIIPEMNFTWSSDNISKLETTGIFHNAGIGSKYMGDIPVFYKGEYHLGKSPFSDPHLELVYNNEQNKTLANSFYVSKLINLKQKYNLN